MELANWGSLKSFFSSNLIGQEVSRCSLWRTCLCSHCAYVHRLLCTKHLSIGYTMQKTYKVNTLWILVAGLDSSNRNWRPTTNGFLKICTISYNFHAKSSFSSSFPFLKDLEPFQSISTPGNVGICCSQGASSAKTRSLKPPSSESEAPVQVKSRPRSSHLAKETQTFHFGKFMGKINGKVKYNKYIMWK